MKTPATILLFVLLAVSILRIPYSESRESGSKRSIEGLRPGAMAPDFSLPDASGNFVSLSSYRGKSPVVLIFGSYT